MIRKVRLLNNFCCKSLLLVSVTFFLIPITSVSSCIRIACRVDFCVIRVRRVWSIISSVVDCQLFQRFYQRIRFISLLTCQYRFFILSLCIGHDGILDEIIHSYVIGIRFLFYNDYMYCISSLLIGKWCTVTIIVICYGYTKFRILFFSLGCHAHSFTRCVNLVKEILSTLEYIKIYWLLDKYFILDNWIIRNCRFLMLWLIIFIFSIVYALVDALWFSLIRRNLIDGNDFWFVFVRRTDLR